MLLFVSAVVDKKNLKKDFSAKYGVLLDIARTFESCLYKFELFVVFDRFFELFLVKEK